MKREIRKNYFNKIADNSVSIFIGGDEILENADAVHNFAVNHHFFYLTGINKPKSALVLIKKDGEEKEILFIERNTELLAKWQGARMSVEEAHEVSAIDKKDIKFYDEFEDVLNGLSKGKSGAKYEDLSDYYFTLDNDDEFRQRDLIERLQLKNPQINIKNSFSTVTKLRMVKTESEVKLIRKAITITEEGLNNLMKNAPTATTENELEAYYDFTMKKNDVKVSFHTIAASGANATVLHYHDNNAKLNKEDLILFDLGVRYKEYCSDISRTFPLNGEFIGKKRELYSIVLEANKEAIKMVKTGITMEEINNVVKEILSAGMIKLGYIKEASEISKYYFHGIGHHLGLDVHDVSKRGEKLEVGNIVTIEPGLYIPESNIGIRIEDDILVTKDGYENLSISIIKEIDDIESFMRS